MASSATGLADAVGTVLTGSLYLRGVAGQQYDVWLRWVNTDATTTDGSVVTVTATGAWQEVTGLSVAVAAGKTGDSAVIMCRTHTQRAESFHAAHVMLQAGAAVVSPYVATSQGATATRAAARVQFPTSMLSSQQGWWAVRMLAGFPSTDPTPRRIVSWRDVSTNVLELIYAGAGVMSQQSYAGGANSIIANQSAVWSVGDALTVVGTWAAGATMAVSVNGANFSTSTLARALATITAAQADIGRLSSAAQQWIDSTVLWFVCGSGVLTNTDAAALAALPNITPAAFPDVAASLSGRWLTYAPVGPKFRRVRVGEPIVTPR